jgi:hypothetical protein
MDRVEASIFQVYSESRSWREMDGMTNILLELAEKSVQSTLIY